MIDNQRKPAIRYAEFNDAWEQRELSHWVNRYDNLRVPITASNRIAGTTPYYGANGIQDFVEGYTHDGEFILLAEDGANDTKQYPVQYVCGKIWVNNHTHCLQSKVDIADNKFMKYAISQSNIEPFLVGGGRSKLNADAMMRLEITAAHLDEQQRIGHFFTKLDNLITLHQREYDKALNIKKAMLEKMFPKNGEDRPEIRFKGFTEAWEQRKLDEIVKIFDGVHQTPDYKSQGIMFLSVENISDLRSNKFISKEAFEKYYKEYPQKGDVLMTRIGDVGSSNVVETYEKIAYYVSLALLKPLKIDSYFLCNSIHSSSFQNNMKGKTLTTAVPQKINKEEIGKIDIVVPKSNLEQQRIGAYFKELDNSSTLHQRELKKLKNMKKALLEKMFVQG